MFLLPVTLTYHVEGFSEDESPARVIITKSGGQLMFDANVMAIRALLERYDDLTEDDLTLLEMKGADRDDFVGMKEVDDTGVWL